MVKVLTRIPMGTYTLESAVGKAVIYSSQDSCLSGTWSDGQIVTGSWIHKTVHPSLELLTKGFPAVREHSIRSGNAQNKEFIRVVDKSHPTDEDATVPALGGDVKVAE